MRTAKGLLGEFAVIVLGVLVAVAADRWNQDRLDRRMGTEYLTSLISELAADSARLQEYATDSEARSESCVSLLYVVRSTDPDSTARALYLTATGTPLPHTGGATFTEIQSTGALGLLPEGVPQLVYDYYGYANGTLERIENVRRVERSAMVEAANRSGSLMPREVVSLFEFTERLRAYPDIESVVMGCVASLRTEAGLVTAFWLPRLSETLADLRQIDRE